MPIGAPMIMVGVMLMHGYREIFRRYFLTPKEPVAYPHPEWLRRS